MRALTASRVLLGVTGGIAAYKAAYLTRLLVRGGAVVDVALTRSAEQFVGATTFQGLSGRSVHTGVFDERFALDHIRLAREAKLVVIAPATADFLARVAQGRADDLLAATVLATDAPVLMAPAMNDRMWAKRATRRNVALLREDGVQILDPVTGALAEGEGDGPGRMVEPEVIFEHCARLLTPVSRLRGSSVVVTAGATQEAIDPVRYISNHSSGRMGVAIAAAAWRRGAQVTLIAGSMSVPPPVGVRVIRALSTSEMEVAVRDQIGTADLLVMAAAPADFAPDAMSEVKIAKGSGFGSLALRETPDILSATVALRPPHCIAVGFALETHDTVARATEKLERKALHMIVANNALEPGAGFGSDTNKVTILTASGERLDTGVLPKTEVAEIILDRVEEVMRD